MKAETLKKSILQYAMQGKLVAQDPNDEPASELLKRIKSEKEQLIKDGKIKKEKTLQPIPEDEIPFFHAKRPAAQSCSRPNFQLVQGVMDHQGNHFFLDGRYGRLSFSENPGDPTGDQFHFLFLQATGSNGRGTDADTAGFSRLALIPGYHIFIDGNIGHAQPGFQIPTADRGIAQIQQQ